MESHLLCATYERWLIDAYQIKTILFRFNKDFSLKKNIIEDIIFYIFYRFIFSPKQNILKEEYVFSL